MHRIAAMRDIETMPARVEKARSQLGALRDQLRDVGAQADDPRGAALFETAAEVLSGLERAFEHYSTRSEPAWRP
jgi:hypothetical protein